MRGLEEVYLGWCSKDTNPRPKTKRMSSKKTGPRRSMRVSVPVRSPQADPDFPLDFVTRENKYPFLRIYEGLYQAFYPLDPERRNITRMAVHTDADGGMGYGLHAKIDLNKGDYVSEYTGEHVPKAQAKELSRRKAMQSGHFYLFGIKEYTWREIPGSYTSRRIIIDARGKAEQSRVINPEQDDPEYPHPSLINHSCDANIRVGLGQRVTGPGNYDFTPTLILYASKDISAGTELSFNYRYNGNLDNPNESTLMGFYCQCQSEVCEKVIGNPEFPGPRPYPDAFHKDPVTHLTVLNDGWTWEAVPYNPKEHKALKNDGWTWGGPVSDTLDPGTTPRRLVRG